MKYVLLLTLALGFGMPHMASAGKYKKCDKQEKKCKKNPLRKATGECKKARKRCEKDMAKKESKKEAIANAPLPVEPVEGDMIMNSAFEKKGGKNGAPHMWKLTGAPGSWKVHGGRKNARTGSNAIQMTKGIGSISQMIPLPGEGKSKGFYTLRYWIKGNGVGNKTRLSIQAEGVSRDASTVEKLGDHKAISGKWTMHQKTIAIKGDEFATAVKFTWAVDRNDAKKNGSIWIDDVSLVRE